VDHLRAGRPTQGAAAPGSAQPKGSAMSGGLAAQLSSPCLSKHDLRLWSGVARRSLSAGSRSGQWAHAGSRPQRERF
jgi:hypothetical protein